MSKSNNENSRRDFMTATGAATGLAALATLFGGSKMVNAQELGINAMGPTPEQAQAFLVAFGRCQLFDRPAANDQPSGLAINIRQDGLGGDNVLKSAIHHLSPSYLVEKWR